MLNHFSRQFAHHKALLGLVLVCLLCGITQAGIIRVNDDSPAGGSGDGSSWDLAYNDLGHVLKFVAGPGDQVWVAIGTYKPAYPGNNPPDSTDSSFTFEIPSDVKVYGGFDATETVLEERAKLYDRTTLSGDLPVTGSNPTGADAYSVVTIRTGGSNARVDGFNVIRGLSTYSDETARGSGGGVYASGVVFFTLSNLTIKNCTAFRGGGLYVNGGKFHVNHTVFENNTAEIYDPMNRGGGAYVAGITEDSDMHSVVFRNNLCVSDPFGSGNLNRIGGGLAARLLTARLRIVNGLFHDNEAPTGAGAGVQATNAPHGVSFINCTFSQNVAGPDPTGGQGAALSFASSGPHHTLENCRGFRVSCG